MKKIITIITTLVITLTLCSCGNSGLPEETYGRYDVWMFTDGEYEVDAETLGLNGHVTILPNSNIEVQIDDVSGTCSYKVLNDLSDGDFWVIEIEMFGSDYACTVFKDGVVCIGDETGTFMFIKEGAII